RHEHELAGAAGRIAGEGEVKGGLGADVNVLGGLIGVGAEAGVDAKAKAAAEGRVDVGKHGGN
ncbi:hypothetical protein DFQ30_002199, partial [Apophysomyces sp. BC1015]